MKAIEIPEPTLRWLLEEENPAVAVLTRRQLLAEADTPETLALWGRRNGYEPVRRVLEAQQEDGSWAPPARDYNKYWGSLWQLLFLGELWADGSDERVRRGAAYAFSRQLPDGSWSCNGRKDAAIQCLTANVGRSLARLGFSRDERVVHALAWIAGEYRRQGSLGCRGRDVYSLNGYCHMVAPKLLLFLAEVPRELWPDGASELCDACVAALRDKQVHRCLPKRYAEFQKAVMAAPPAERAAVRERFLAENRPAECGDKPGWLKFGYPLSYNSDALEALAALAGVGEERRPEYEPAMDAVRSSADGEGRWTMRNSLNGKMLADIERKGAASKWLTLRAHLVLRHFT